MAKNGKNSAAAILARIIRNRIRQAELARKRAERLRRIAAARERERLRKINAAKAARAKQQAIRRAKIKASAIKTGKSALRRAKNSGKAKAKLYTSNKRRKGSIENAKAASQRNKTKARNKIKNTVKKGALNKAKASGKAKADAYTKPPKGDSSSRAINEARSRANSNRGVRNWERFTGKGVKEFKKSFLGKLWRNASAGIKKWGRKTKKNLETKKYKEVKKKVKNTIKQKIGKVKEKIGKTKIGKKYLDALKKTRKSNLEKVAKGTLKKVGKLGKVQTAIDIGKGIKKAFKDRKNAGQHVGRAVGRAAGEAVGGAIGAAIGSAIPIPVVGTAFGFLVGSAIGRVAGDKLAGVGAKVGGWFQKKFFARGGLVAGGPKLGIIGEEGTPEMVIPLGAHRRQRGVELWERAGKMLGTNGGQESAIKQPKITLPTAQKPDVMGTLRNNMGDVAEEVAGVLNTTISGQFENTPA